MNACSNLISAFLALVLGFLRLAITQVKPGAAAIPPTAAGQNGAMPDTTGITTILNALSNNASPAFGNFTMTKVSAPISAATYTGAQMVGGFLRREATASFTDCTDTATNIVNAIPGAMPNQTFAFLLANCGTGTATLAGGTGVTIAGSATVGQTQLGIFLGQVTGSAAVTISRFCTFGGVGANFI